MKNVHVFFDLDRTLWDFEKNSEAALRKIYKEENIREFTPSFVRFLKKYKQINNHLWKRYGKNEITKEYLRTARFLDTIAHFGNEDEELAARMGEQYIAISPHQTNLLPNTHETLQNLQNEGYSLHIITNGFKEVQFIKLRESKLTDYFNTILCSEEVGVNKPHQKVFAHAQELTKSEKKNSIMIGDDYRCDVQGAIRFGWQAIHFDPECKFPPTLEDFRIRDLKEIPELLPWMLKG